MQHTLTIQELLRCATERDPEQAVFVREEQVTSYAELELRSSRFADGLRRLGLKHGDRVALLLDGEVEFLIAYYGIAKAGAVVVPLCADTRTGPLVYALSHAGATAAILEGSKLRFLDQQAHKLPQLRWLITRGKADGMDLGHVQQLSFDRLLASGDLHHEAPCTDDALLSITYTSGTTGTPKGVMLAHRNLVANVRSIIAYLALSAADRVAMVLPFYYVYGNSVLHTHIGAGGTIVHAGSMAFPAQVLQAIEQHRCTGFSGVPATFARLLDGADINAYDLASLRYVTQAGAAMTPALTQRLRAALPSTRIFVMYGQTEASARLAYLPPEALERKVGSAGRAIPGVTLRVVDRDGLELPRGAVGEVVAQGDNIMLGYWNDPEATRRALREGRLHTGDLASMDEDGFLYISGRESEMIKSGAHRIGPAEIEDVIARVPGVRSCAVAGVPDALLGQAIAAFIVPDDSAVFDRQAIMRACLQELPRFKLPEHIMMVRELPHNQNNKLQRSALVELYLKQQPTGGPGERGYKDIITREPYGEM